MGNWISYICPCLKKEEEQGNQVMKRSKIPEQKIAENKNEDINNSPVPENPNNDENNKNDIENPKSSVPNQKNIQGKNFSNDSSLKNERRLDDSFE